MAICYVDLCEECALGLGWRKISLRPLKLGSSIGLCDSCWAKDKEVNDAIYYGIKYTGDKMSDASYEIMTDQRKTKLPSLFQNIQKPESSKLIFGKHKTNDTKTM